MPPLELSVGYASETGPRQRNEDYCGVVTPTGNPLILKGAVMAIADGISGNAGGREAAEYTVRGVLSDYYATPDTWQVSAALDKVLNAINRWLLAQSNTNRDFAGMATTLSLMVMRGSRAYLAHIGDSRIYRLQNLNLQQLTIDHVWDRADMRHVLKRAVGLDQHLAVDYSEVELQENDVFLLATDGVWETLGEKSMHEILLLHKTPQRAASVLAETALARGGQDNASAIVVRVDKIGNENLQDILAHGEELPLPPRLKPGQQLDGFEILQILHESRVTILYKARHPQNSQVLVLKTLKPNLQNDVESCQHLLTEEWLSKRVLSHYFPQVIPLSPDIRRHLYYAMTYHEGATLQEMLDSGYHFTVAEIVQIGIRTAKGLGALHRLSIIHRDIKPANLHSGVDGKLRILDLGVAFGVGTEEAQSRAGTPSFIAPELFSDEPATIQSDIYALGVTLYHLLTRHFPFGEIEPFQRPRFTEPTPPTRHRPEIPQWLENIILKAVARDKTRRFETVEELLLALEGGEVKSMLPPRRLPLVERNPLALWRSMAFISLVINLMLIYIVLVS